MVRREVVSAVDAVKKSAPPEDDATLLVNVQDMRFSGVFSVWIAAPYSPEFDANVVPVSFTHQLVVAS